MYHIPTDQNGNIQWPDDLEQVLAEHADGSDAMAIFNAEVANWTQLVDFIVPEFANIWGCELVVMVDSDAEILWAYCMEHGLQPNAKIRDLGPLVQMAINISVEMGVIPPVIIAVAMFHNFVNKLFAEQQASMNVPVEHAEVSAE